MALSLAVLWVLQAILFIAALLAVPYLFQFLKSFGKFLKALTKGLFSAENGLELPLIKFEHKFSMSTVADSQEMCSICLDPMKTGDILCEIPQCKHTFHAQCIRTWIDKSGICPYCRRDVDPNRRSSSQFNPGFVHSIPLIDILQT